MALLVSCTATPLPEAPFEGDFEFMPATGSLPFIAVGGAIDSDHVLRIWELNTNAAPRTFTPDADGSIDGTLSAMAVEARLEVIDGRRRSTPLDMNVMTNTALTFTECVQIDRQLEAELGQPGSIVIDNQCDAALGVSMRTRVVAPITLPDDLTLAAGELVMLEIVATSATDEIVLIDLTGAAEETRALTVYTR